MTKGQLNSEKSQIFLLRHSLQVRSDKCDCSSDKVRKIENFSIVTQSERLAHVVTYFDGQSSVHLPLNTSVRSLNLPGHDC